MNKQKIYFGLLAFVMAFAVHFVNVTTFSTYPSSAETVEVIDEFEFAEKMMATLVTDTNSASTTGTTSITDVECRYANCRKKLAAAKNRVLALVNATCIPKTVTVRCCNADGQKVTISDTVYPSPKCKSDSFEAVDDW